MIINQQMIPYQESRFEAPHYSAWRRKKMVDRSFWDRQHRTISDWSYTVEDHYKYGSLSENRCFYRPTKSDGPVTIYLQDIKAYRSYPIFVDEFFGDA